MAYYRNTWILQDTTYNVGWSETWYTNASNAVAALANHEQYPIVRAALMMDTAMIVSCRTAAVGKPRDSLYSAFSQAGGQPHATAPPAGVWDCLLWRRDNALNNAFGHFFMRSVPAGIFTGRTYNENAPTIPSNWKVARGAFVTEITSGEYYVKTTQGLAPVTVSFQQIAEMIPQYRTERKIGRPFDVLHGRKKSTA